MIKADHLTPQMADAVREQGHDARALATVYSRAIECYEAKEKGTRPGAPDDGTEIKEDSANAIIPE